MSIKIECLKCRHRISMKAKLCTHCGAAIPKIGRIYWSRVKVKGKDLWKRLGQVTHEYAKHYELTAKQAELLGTRTNNEQVKLSEVTYAYVQKIVAEDRNLQYQKDTKARLQLIVERLNNPPVSKLTQQHIEQLRIYLLNKGLSKRTVNRYIAAGKAAWNYSMRDMPNPFRVKAYNEAENIKPEFLSDAQRTMLIDTSKKYGPVRHAIIMLALTTGLRRSEILNLKWENIDFVESTITTRQKGGRIITKYPPLSVMQLLDALPRDSEYLLANPHTGQPYSKSDNKWWWKLCAESGAPNIRFHTLRHDVGYRVYSATGDQRLTQEALGHSNISTSLRYTKMPQTRLDLIRDILDTSRGTSRGTKGKKANDNNTD